MKVLASWLKEWVSSLPQQMWSERLAAQLTEAGIEVESIEMISPKKEDFVLEIKSTPNRGDCLSVLGIAREVALLNNVSCKEFAPSIITAKSEQHLPVSLQADMACPIYCGRVISNLNPTLKTPQWMQDRLEKSGYKLNSLIVDVTNYVMLEVGQPLHAFDLEKLGNQINVRFAKPKENLTLLNDEKVTLDSKTLVIADEKNVLAIAGVMGGRDSAVNEKTNAIFLESAYFDPIHIQLAARHYNLRTEASYRFERRVDPSLSYHAIERVTELLIQLDPTCIPGTITRSVEKGFRVTQASVFLRQSKLEKLLGISISKEKVEDIFKRLGFSYVAKNQGWEVTAPSFRSDIGLEEDVVEEIARLYGYSNIPSQTLSLPIMAPSNTEYLLPTMRLKQFLADRGYREALTFSFTKPQLLESLGYDTEGLSLTNPISEELATLRPCVWVGLLEAARYNQRRQQPRVRYFEIGARFERHQNQLLQETVLAGLCTGSHYPEQWGEKERQLDFFDVKGDVEALLQFTKHECSFQPWQHHALHPGQAAVIVCGGKSIGYIGSLHPRVLQAEEFKQPIFVFEIELSALLLSTMPQYQSVSKYPSVRRDLSMIVSTNISIQQLQDSITESMGGDLKELRVFDIYQGKGIAPDQKSVALGLILQNDTHTLTDQEIDEKIAVIVEKLIKQYQIVLREQ